MAWGGEDIAGVGGTESVRGRNWDGGGRDAGMGDGRFKLVDAGLMESGNLIFKDEVPPREWQGE